jgi:RsiW-degrading membrane proteinase PrsW (M82 family)
MRSIRTAGEISLKPSGPRLPAPSILFPWRAWLAHPRLRSWTTWLLVALVAVPPLAVTLVPPGSTDAGVSAAAFAAYFALAWLLVLWMVVRPQRVRGGLLAQVVALALILESPLAIGLERALAADTDNLLLSIATIGIPEELAKLLPVALLAVVHRRAWMALAPRDYLFLGAVSGLAFGAVEAVVYVVHMPVTGTGAALVLVWRLVTDPIMHACWAGIAGYFLGLATRYREPGSWAALAGLGIGVPAVLHGLNDWVAPGVNIVWVLVTVISTVLFLAYALVGITAPPVRRLAARAVHRARTTGGATVFDPPTLPIPLQRPAPGPAARPSAFAEFAAQRVVQPGAPGARLPAE